MLWSEIDGLFAAAEQGGQIGHVTTNSRHTRQGTRLYSFLSKVGSFFVAVEYVGLRNSDGLMRPLGLLSCFVTSLEVHGDKF